MSKRKKRRWLSPNRISEISGRVAMYKQAGITDISLIASKCECSEKLVEMLLSRKERKNQ